MIAKPAALNNNSHFIVTDISNVRFETDHDSHTAVIGRNDIDLSLELRRSFCLMVKALRADGNLIFDAFFEPEENK
jgi:hypothetical protein